MGRVGLAGTAVVATLRVYLMLAAVSLVGGMFWSLDSAPRAATMQGLVAGWYPRLIGERDGRSCPSYPVCSLYARQAVMRHGLLLGSWIALDRLIHEGGDLVRGPFVRVRGERRLYDPLARNTFWLGDGYEHRH